MSEWVSEVAQSCPTFCDPMDCRLPGFSVHGILQTRILECCISFSRGLSQPRDRTQVSLIAGRRFTLWATREALKWSIGCAYILAQSYSSLHAWCTWPRWQTPHGLFISHFMYSTHLSARETGYHIPVKNFWSTQLSEKTFWWYTSSCTLLA